jgi:peptidoglycan hydrolase-like protein with peptidoglycan-binding domain
MMSTRKRLILLFGCSLLFAATLTTLNFTHAPVAFAAFSQSCPSTRSEGSSGALVQVIQFRLNSLNVSDGINHPFGNPFPLSTDGGFGSMTTEAVRDFQSTFGLSTNGEVGNQTWGTMGFCTGTSRTIPTCCSSVSNSHFPGTIEEGSTGTFVIELQRGLNVDANLGVIGQGSWFPLLVDGNFGANTKAAVESLQSAAGITPNGVVGQQTWAAFGMSY